MSERDDQLIAEFNARRSEEAFAALVRQHINLVFATALRQVGDASAAEEITQNVFVALAQAAGKLGSHPTIAGWLHQTALNKSREWLRSELRRRRREQVAVNLDTARAEGDSVWSPLVPLLDEALLELREPDRQAIILHFMEGQTFQEVGSALGVGEDAARKRVGRCLDQLTHFFRRRGFAVPALAAGAPLFALSSHAAPAGLAASVTTAGLAAAHAAASASTLTLIKGALKIMAWTKAKSAIVAGAVVLLAGGVTIPIIMVHADRIARAKAGAIPADRYVLYGLKLASGKDQLVDLRLHTWSKERQVAKQRISSLQHINTTTNATTIDLSPFVNLRVTAWATQNGRIPRNTPQLTTGVKLYAGVPFDVSGIVRLNSITSEKIREHFPVEVDKLPINEKFTKFYLLHGAYVGNGNFGQVVGRLVLHYADGSTNAIDLIAGQTVFDCWNVLFKTGVDPFFKNASPGTEIAWWGSNSLIERLNPDESLVLFKSVFQNPRPDVAVTSVDYVSTMTETGPFLAGLTVE